MKYVNKQEQEGISKVEDDERNNRRTKMRYIVNSVLVGSEMTTKRGKDWISEGEGGGGGETRRPRCMCLVACLLAAKSG